MRENKESVKRIWSIIAAAFALLSTAFIMAFIPLQNEEQQQISVVPQVNDHFPPVCPPEDEKYQDGYFSEFRTVRIDTPEGSLTFQMPNDWLIESRHSGERKLTSEEKREFLATTYDGDFRSNPELISDYMDSTWSMIQNFTPDEVERYYAGEPDDPFPQISVSSGKKIGYWDMSFDQIDFYLMSDFSAQSTWLNEAYAQKDDEKPYAKWCSAEVDGNLGDVRVIWTERGPDGQERTTKGGSGGRTYYIPIQRGKDMLVINKQTKGDEDHKQGFLHILETLKVN